MERLSKGIKRFLKVSEDYSSEDIRVVEIESDGSDRRFYRVLWENDSFVIMENFPITENIKKENLSYLRIAQHLNGKGLPFPSIYLYDLSEGIFILEDAGDMSLERFIKTYPNDTLTIYRRVLDVLLEIQIRAIDGFDTNWCYQSPYFDTDIMRRFESEYFKREFLSDLLSLRVDLSFLDPIFDHISLMAYDKRNISFLHRDFQSRNILIKERKIYLVDWQSARLGPPGYDLASLLIDPYVELSEAKREELFSYYMERTKETKRFDMGFLLKSYPYLMLQRNMQILGAFSYLSLKKGKEKFKKFILPAFQGLLKIISTIDDPKLLPFVRFLYDIDINSVMEPR